MKVKVKEKKKLKMKGEKESEKGKGKKEKKKEVRKKEKERGIKENCTIKPIPLYYKINSSVIFGQWDMRVDQIVSFIAFFVPLFLTQLLCLQDF